MAVAEELLLHQALDGDEVQTIVDYHQPADDEGRESGGPVTIEARRARQRAAINKFTAAHTGHDIVVAEYDDLTRPWGASCRTCGKQIRPEGTDESDDEKGGAR